MIIKLNQLLRKFIYRHLWVSVINAVSLKEIEQLVFKQQTFKDYKTSSSIPHCQNTIGEHPL